MLGDYSSISFNYALQKENNVLKGTGKLTGSKLLSFKQKLCVLSELSAAYRAKFWSETLLRLRLWSLFTADGLLALAF